MFHSHLCLISQKAAKLANYAKYQRLCDGLFVVFSLSFFFTRLVFFPFWYEENVQLVTL